MNWLLNPYFLLQQRLLFQDALFQIELYLCTDVLYLVYLPINESFIPRGEKFNYFPTPLAQWLLLLPCTQNAGESGDADSV